MKKNSKTILSVLAIAFFTFIAFGSMDDDKKSSDSTSATSIKENNTKITQVGEPLKTEYFDVTVNKVGVEESINTGNQFADLPKESGTKYLVLNATFKNTSNESRMLMDGELLINYNGQDYKFDKSETVMLEGWGLLLDQINPLTSKTTKLVYKIPNEIKGTFYYRPGRANSDDLIELGAIE